MLAACSSGGGASAGASATAAGAAGGDLVMARADEASSLVGCSKHPSAPAE